MRQGHSGSGDLLDTIGAWLLDQALSDDSIEHILIELCTRMVDAGVPLARLSVGRTVLHPVIGLMDMQWDRETGKIVSSTISRTVIRGLNDVQAPFAKMSRGEADHITADLTDPEQVARFPLFAELAGQGITAYHASSRRYGIGQDIFGTFGAGFGGGSVSFSTKRFSGFSRADPEGLERLITPLCICLRIADDRFVATEILETYLGRITGSQVLNGQIERGDGQQIECAILYSDPCGSVDLSQSVRGDDARPRHAPDLHGRLYRALPDPRHGPRPAQPARFCRTCLSCVISAEISVTVSGAFLAASAMRHGIRQARTPSKTRIRRMGQLLAAPSKGQRG